MCVSVSQWWMLFLVPVHHLVYTTSFQQLTYLYNFLTGLFGSWEFSAKTMSLCWNKIHSIRWTHFIACWTFDSYYKKYTHLDFKPVCIVIFGERIGIHLQRPVSPMFEPKKLWTFLHDQISIFQIIFVDGLFIPVMLSYVLVNSWQFV